MQARKEDVKVPLFVGDAVACTSDPEMNMGKKVEDLCDPRQMGAGGGEAAAGVLL